jgi:acyl-CoA synthetase (AMP-forming)/AMP-acid ligase II
MNIHMHLEKRAHDTPNRIALVSPKISLTYAQLHERSRRYANGLAKLGIEKGTRTVVMLKPGPDFLAVCFALMRLGAIMVLVDPGMGKPYLAKCLRESAPQAFIGIPLAHFARIVLGWGTPSIKINVCSGLPLPGITSLQQMVDSPSQSDTKDIVTPSDTAAIAFTSGSTGPPKGVVISYGIFEAQCRLLGEAFDIRPGEVDLATFPLFSLFDPALQMTTVFPKMNFSKPGKVHPPNIIRAIQRNKVTHMFGSPALLRRIASFARGQELKLPSLKRVLTAGAPASLDVIGDIQRLLIDAQVHTPYGATEALPISSISSDELFKLEVEGKRIGVCIGRPLPGVQVWIVPISETPIEHLRDVPNCDCGEIGELVVAGPNVSQKYDNNPNANMLSKVSLDSNNSAHRLGDLGYFDEAGRLWFCGRKTHRVVTSNATLFTVPIESIFNQHPAVLRTALVGVGKPPNQQPILCVELKPLRGLKRWRTRKKLLQMAGENPSTSEIKKILFHHGFPVDARHNSKIFREKLTQWAALKVG